MGKKTINALVKKIVSNRSCNMKNKFDKFNEIDRGEYGKVYKACINDACKNKIAVKKSDTNLSAEYLISKRIANMKVPFTHGYVKCPTDDFMLMEYLSGNTLKNVLNKLGKDSIKSIVIQVLYILYSIHNKYPSFRHHDLHLANIMIMRKRNDVEREITINDKKITFNEAKVEVKLMDFGLATMMGTINPVVTKSKKFKSDFGIYSKSDSMYDVHLFLNSLWTSMKKNGRSETIQFINDILPKTYLGEESEHIKEYRLRSDVQHTLPTYEDIFKHPYFHKNKKNSVMTILNQIKQVPKAKSFVIKKKVPVNQNEAKTKAMIVLKKNAENKNKKFKKPTLKKKLPSLTKTNAKPLNIHVPKKNNSY